MSTKLCSKCKLDLPVENFSKDKAQKSGLRCACKLCSAKEFKAFKTSPGYTKRLHSNNTHREKLKQEAPIKSWAHTAFHAAKQRAKKNNREFTITKLWVEENAPIICPLLNVTLIYNADRSTANTASLDRKDSAKGYTPENCKIISFKANRIKSNASLEEIALLASNLERY